MKPLKKNIVRGVAIGALLLVPAVASADPFPARAERILSPGRTASGEDSAEALVLNPANLANMPSFEARWTGVRCPDTRRAACGHAFELAMPLIWGVSKKIDIVPTLDNTDDFGPGRLTFKP